MFKFNYDSAKFTITMTVPSLVLKEERLLFLKEGGGGRPRKKMGLGCTGRNNGFTYIYQQCQILCKSVPSHLLVHLHMVQTCKMFDYSFNSHLLPL